MKKIYGIVFVIIFNSAFGQTNTFFKIYYNYLGHASCVVETDSGGFILTSPAYASAYDFLIRTDSSGNEITNKTYCSHGVWSITRALDGNFVFSTSTKNPCYTPGNWEDVVITKINSNLDTLWTRVYGTTADEESTCIRTLNDGNYIVSASTSGGLISNLFKLDTLGNIIWQNYVSPSSLASVIQDSDGNFIVCGGNTGWYITKVNSTGDSVLWNRVFYAAITDAGFLDLIELADGNYFAGGFTDHPAFYKYVKIDRMTGDTIWSSPASGSLAYYYSFNNGHNGNIIVADGYLRLIDQSGNTIWNKGFINVEFRYAIPTNDGGYIASGYFQQSMGIIRPVLLKTDSLGNFSATGINELIKSESYVFYPNPLTTQSTLTFSNPQKEKFLFTLYDITGRIVESVSTVNDKVILSKGNKEEGVYLFNLTKEKTGEGMNGKIIVQ